MAKDTPKEVKKSPEEEVEVLFPDVDVKVRDPDTGETVGLKVREFRFLEGLHAQQRGHGLLKALTQIAAEAVEKAEPQAGDDGDPISSADIEAIFGEHAEEWLALIGMATGRDPEWLARLPDRDAADLNDAMWRVNGPFFVRRLAAGAISQKHLTDMFHSLRSSTNSSGPDTDKDTAKSPAA